MGMNMKNIVFWDVTQRAVACKSQAYSASLFACSAHSSTLKMEEVHSSKTSVNFYQTTRRHIPEDSTTESLFSISHIKMSLL